MPLTTSLHLRVSRRLLAAANERARSQGIRLSQVMRFVLIRYARGDLSLSTDTGELRRMTAEFDERLELIAPPYPGFASDSRM